MVIVCELYERGFTLFCSPILLRYVARYAGYPTLNISMQDYRPLERKATLQLLHNVMTSPEEFMEHIRLYVLICLLRCCNNLTSKNCVL